jgi:hypothetical protein
VIDNLCGVGVWEIGKLENKRIVICYYVLSCGLDRRKKMKQTRRKTD